MTAAFRAVQWNAHKRRYDLAAGLAVVALSGAFVGAAVLATPSPALPSGPILLLRALGAAAGTLLTAILCIGPLARLDSRFAPLLYNRRHLGVLTALLALLHGFVALNWYHGFGAMDPLVSLLANGGGPGAPGLPFQPLGALALLVLLLLAATSHDYWLAALGPRVWKGLHMLVYPAWLLVVAHVAFGAMQTHAGWTVPALLATGVGLTGALHLAAGMRERRRDRAHAVRGTTSGAPRGKVGGARELWLDAGPVAAAGEGCAVRVEGERGPIAVFRHEDRLFAIGGTCVHQGGPLAEGRIVDGCVTCPWHGYQYRPADGHSPPPFDDRVPTHRARVRDGRIEVDATAAPPGTVHDGAPVVAPVVETDAGEHASRAASAAPFYVGYLPLPAALRPFVRNVLAVALIASAAIGAAFALAQPDAGPAVWEQDTIAIEGVLTMAPYPLLHAREADGSDRAFVLVAEGKFGAAGRATAALGGAPARRVRVRGLRLRRQDQCAFELTSGDGAIEVLGDAAAPAPVRVEGERELVGEIVDPKCWLGAMKPGSGLVHRACAELCIRGGIPPCFVGGAPGEPPRFFVVTDLEGRACNDALAPHAGVLVALRGRIDRLPGLDVLRLDPTSLRPATEVRR